MVLTTGFEPVTFTLSRYSSHLDYALFKGFLSGKFKPYRTFYRNH